ncbi:Rad17 domain-containing protein [Cephalotus follicularis]|uniref:Rad17 domain-containing protein n=1 Tax=Cephalotus follicularis TaxID=3775 RepID=A0A1Q3B9Y8_CEPFO|nr:Rad17 domain-containing protein [Cephalotus follicularis]
MAKRNSIVVLSSDDEDSNEYSPSANRSYVKPKSRPFITRTNARVTKKPRVSASRSRLRHQSSAADEIRLSFEDFDQVFNGFKVSAGYQKNNSKELWVNKYKPRSFEELAVHKKKVEEVKRWFEERLKTSKDESSNQVLLITGQAGTGKSATIGVIASHLGASLCEWNTPTPTIWQEHMHNSNTGIHYTSKLDEFQNFVERIRKYGLIPVSSTGGSKSSVILVIDDLPVTNSRVAFERLQTCLLLLVRSILIPAAILVTDYGKSDSADYTTRCLEELQLSLESAGACKVAFNPITYNSIRKTLSRICRQEQCNVTAEQIEITAKASGGDIRNAITSLQFFCLKLDSMLALSHLNSTSSHAKDEVDEPNGFSFQFGRDETLSLFHALGKFLHNKRETEIAIAMDQDAFFVREKFSRLPLKMEAPEKVLCQAHGQARPIADFLHENVLDFMSEEAVDDSWAVASYIGDADLLLSSFRGMMGKNDESDNVLQSAGVSVAVRGVLYGNSHPLPPRWHAIRRPKLWQVEQSILHNKKEMVKQRFIAYNGSSFSDLSVIATEYKPAMRWLGYGSSGGLLMQDNKIDDDDLERMSLDGQESEVSDDEIEDW